MAIRLNGGLSLEPTQTRRIDGRSYSIPLVAEQPATQADILEAEKTYVSPKTITPIDPLSLVGFGAPGGLSPTGVMDLWQLAFGSAETQQDISLGITAGATGYVEPFGIVPEGTTQEILDVPIVDFPGSETPFLPAADVVLPGIGDVIGGTFEEGGLFGNLFGGLGDMLKGALPWLLLLGAGYLLLRRK